MPVPTEVHDFLLGSHPGLAGLALWVRKVVLASEPDLTERGFTCWTCRRARRDGYRIGLPPVTAIREPET
jgi:hypothetical protein